MISRKDLRVRFAPSPTGGLHPGNARVAVFNWLFAKKNSAKFILRIEDTDEERSTAEHEASIIDDLKWLGINWDEGPYRQSERLERYRASADSLKERGFLYRCYCSNEELENERSLQLKSGKPPRYSGKCKGLSTEERLRKESDGSKYALRFDVEKFISELNSGHDMINFHDLIKNREAASVMSNPARTIGDFVIMKQSGIPTYNFAVVVDDIDMKITHVFRGEDHVSNTFRQIMIFEALGVKGEDIPSFGHIPMLLAPDKTKLSKRSGGVPIHEYKAMGFLSGAMFNHLAFLGGAVRDVEEDAARELLVRSFSHEHTAPSACVYDVDKLKHINMKMIHGLDNNTVLQLLRSNIQMTDEWKAYYDEASFLEIVGMAKEGARLLTEIKDTLDIFVTASIDDESIRGLDADQKKVLEHLYAVSSSGVKISGKIWISEKEKIASMGVLSGAKLFKTLRLLLTGRSGGPPLDGIMERINNDLVMKRLEKVKEITG